MFPLLDTEAANALELLQIWLNLPARSKMAPAHFTMFWSDQHDQHAPTRRAAVSVSLSEFGVRV